MHSLPDPSFSVFVSVCLSFLDCLTGPSQGKSKAAAASTDPPDCPLFPGNSSLRQGDKNYEAQSPVSFIVLIILVMNNSEAQGLTTLTNRYHVLSGQGLSVGCGSSVALSTLLSAPTCLQLGLNNWADNL